ncbi:MAG: winged helix-turn-helix domain-containing protein [Bacillota bacterium]
MPTVLVVDDEENIVQLIKYNLDKENYRVMTAADGTTGLAMATVNLPDLIILDIMLPGRDGLDVCRSLKANPQTAPIPIIMLSARGEDIDKILGLEMGADDYVTKPFSPRELIARVKAALRRMDYKKGASQPGFYKELHFKNLVIRPEKYEVELNENKLNLSPKEFEILEILASSPGRVFSRDLLLEKVWGFNELRETRTVDVHIRYLRQKIEEDPARPVYIETVRGIGYRFSDRI